MQDVKNAKDKKCHSPVVKKETSIFDGILNIFKKTDPEPINMGNSKVPSIRLRSGSPGTRNNCDDIMKATLSSSNPKAIIQKNFKQDMKQLGISSDVKNLKNFKKVL